MSAVAAAARLGGLEVSGRGSGCWTAPTFPFSGGFPVLTSSGTSFCIGLRSFKCFPFLLTTRNTAPRSQPSLLSISSVTSPSLQFRRGRFSSCIKTTSPVLIFLSWSPWVPQLWNSLSPMRYSLVHRFRKCAISLLRCRAFRCSLEAQSSSSLSSVLAGRVFRRHPITKCDGVNTLRSKFRGKKVRTLPLVKKLFFHYKLIRNIWKFIFVWKVIEWPFPGYFYFVNKQNNAISRWTGNHGMQRIFSADMTAKRFISFA